MFSPVKHLDLIKNLIVVITLMLFSALAIGKHNAIPLQVIASQSTEDVSHQYFIQLLSLAINNSNQMYPSREIKVIEYDNFGHEGSLRLIQSGEIDVVWAGTSVERERQMLPIRIPLMRGLLGYRVSIVHKDNLANFNQKGANAFQNETLCQGQYWPDNEILSDHGFYVRAVRSFAQIFKLIDKKRCSFFPRAIFEGYGELKKAQENYPNLAMFDEVILYYPLPYFFFVAKSNKQLAEQIHFGLLSSLNNGSYDELMKNHPLTRHLFPLEQWHNKTFVMINNPNIPIRSEVSESEFLVQLHSQSNMK